MRDYTDITIILDRSGSMAGIREATIEGVNGFIQAQNELPGDGCWSLVQFDDNYERHYQCRSGKEVPMLNMDTYVPRGATALIDAVCKTIDETGTRLFYSPEDKRPNKVLMVIMTDGLENASHQFTKLQLNHKITHQREKYNWQFVFLGANQDAIAEAVKYGVPASSSMTFAATPTGQHVNCMALNKNTRHWKAEGNESCKEFVIDPNDKKEQEELIVKAQIVVTK